MFGTECFTYCAQTGIIATRSGDSPSNFYEYAISRHKLGKLKLIATRAPNTDRADLEWLACNDVYETQQRFSIFERATMIVD